MITFVWICSPGEALTFFEMRLHCRPLAVQGLLASLPAHRLVVPQRQRARRPPVRDRHRWRAAQPVGRPRQSFVDGVLVTDCGKAYALYVGACCLGIQREPCVCIPVDPFREKGDFQEL